MIEAWQFSLSGNSGTRSEKKSLFCGAQKRQNPTPHEGQRNHLWQSQQSQLELGLGVKPYERCRRTLRLWWIFCGFPRNVPSLLALVRKTARPLSRHNDWCARLNPVEKLFGLLHGQSNTAM